jgi:hypothetical protein
LCGQTRQVVRIVQDASAKRRATSPGSSLYRNNHGILVPLCASDVDVSFSSQQVNTTLQEGKARIEEGAIDPALGIVQSRAPKLHSRQTKVH